MADLLQQGSDWLESQRTAFMAQPVIYSRGETSVTVNATLGKTEYDIDDESGLRVKSSILDFLILTEELVLDGQKTVPKSGDRIRVSRGSEIVVFEVMTLAGQGCWRSSDSFGRTFRIHTQQIGTM